MTLLNHIGALLLLFWIILIAAVLDKELRKAWYYSFPTAIVIWIIFEAFYWTFKIFF